jgi:hypothetical protein
MFVRIAEAAGVDGAASPADVRRKGFRVVSSRAASADP